MNTKRFNIDAGSVISPELDIIEEFGYVCPACGSSSPSHNPAACDVMPAEEGTFESFLERAREFDRVARETGKPVIVALTPPSTLRAWSRLVSAAAEASEIFGDDELEEFSKKVRSTQKKLDG